MHQRKKGAGDYVVAANIVYYRSRISSVGLIAPPTPLLTSWVLHGCGSRLTPPTVPPRRVQHLPGKGDAAR
eukprot:8270478-Heterocapsa_arctica.AAC.1